MYATKLDMYRSANKSYRAPRHFCLTVLGGNVINAKNNIIDILLCPDQKMAAANVSSMFQFWKDFKLSEFQVSFDAFY